jgi:hypothetical protein
MFRKFSTEVTLPEFDFLPLVQAQVELDYRMGQFEVVGVKLLEVLGHGDRPMLHLLNPSQIVSVTEQALEWAHENAHEFEADIA